MLTLIIAAGLWLGSILGGSGPYGTVDVWLATYGSPGTIEDGGNFGMGISYYRLKSYQQVTDRYILCDTDGRKHTVVADIAFQQGGKPPFYVDVVPWLMVVNPWSCTGYTVSVIGTTKLGAWSVWDAFVIWNEVGFTGGESGPTIMGGITAEGK